VIANVPAPSLGWTSVAPVEGPGDVEHPVLVDNRELDNGLVRVAVSDDGTLSLNGIEGVGRVVEGGDAGDSYNYAPPEHDRLVEKPEEVAVGVTASGPVRGTLDVSRTYDWGTPVEVTTSVELHAGEPFCRLRVSFDNPCGDHRVRFHLPLAEPAASSAAEGQFAVVERGLEAEGGFGEHPLPTFPAHGFVAAGGVAVLLDHVLEYELVEGRELALTLLRSIGLISRSAHPYRESPAGPELAIPAAQCRGPWSVSFALFPYEGDWHEAGIHTQLERYRHPFLVAGATGSGNERERRGPEFPGLVLSSLRRIEGKLVARVANELPHTTQGLQPWEISSFELG
jgi:mannosylglycerate hydrolase